MNHQRAAVVCDYRLFKKSTPAEGLAFLGANGEVLSIISLVDGEVLRRKPWDYRLRYEQGCMPLFSSET